MQYFDSQRDPVDNTIADSYYFKSTSSTGSSTTIFDDLTIPASPNFPNSTATRYIMNLPGEPYYAGIEAGSATFVVKNVNTTSFLTRVAYNGSLTANTYKIFPSQSNTPARLEAHVGVGSNSAGDVLSWHGRFVTSIISSSEMNSSNPINGFQAIYRDSAGLETMVGVHHKIMEIGIWNMAASNTVHVEHGLTDYAKIRKISAIIVNDSLETYYDIDEGSSAFYYAPLMQCSSIAIDLNRGVNGFYDTVNFNSTIINRGWIYLTYEN
jgi:hypothetical protein